MIFRPETVSSKEYASVSKNSPFTNPFLAYALLASTFAQIAVIYAPPLQWVFRTVPLNAYEWLLILGLSSSVILVVEIDKWLRRRFGRSPAHHLGQT